MGEKHRHQLVTPLANLMTNLLVRNIFGEMFEGFFPCLRVKIYGVDQCSVNIEDDCFDHHSPPCRSIPPVVQFRRVQQQALPCPVLQ